MNINLNFKNLCSSLKELLKEKIDKSDLDKTNANVSAIENSVADISTKIDEKVSTADLSTALESKVNKESGKGLSSNDYTTDEKTKLAEVADEVSELRATQSDIKTRIGDGYNLVDTSLISSATANGITRTNNNDGSITYTGTSTATKDIYVPLMASETLPIGTYIFSPHPSNKNETDYYYQIYKGGTYWKELNINNPISITSKDTYSIGIAIKAGTSINNNFYPMLEKGTVSHNWAGYTGGTGSLNSDVAAIERRTKTTDWIDLLPLATDGKSDKESSSYLKFKKQGNLVNIVGHIKYTDEADNTAVDFILFQKDIATQIVPSFVPKNMFAVSPTNQNGVFAAIENLGSNTISAAHLLIYIQNVSNVTPTFTENPPKIGKGRTYEFSMTYLV